MTKSQTADAPINQRLTRAARAAVSPTLYALREARYSLTAAQFNQSEQPCEWHAEGVELARAALTVALRNRRAALAARKAP